MADNGSNEQWDIVSDFATTVIAVSVIPHNFPTFQATF